MKTCLGKDDFGGKPRTRGLPANLEGFLQRYLQIHFGPAAYRSSDPLLAAIILVERFASSANTDQFSVGLTKLLGSRVIVVAATELIGDLANVFCRSAEGIESDLLKKSLQEALLISIDVRGDSTVTQFRDLLREFLGRYGTIGLIRLFVGLHMFNAIWLEMQESDSVSPGPEEGLGGLFEALEKECFARVDAAIAAGLVRESFD
jgi:hypothetical protein